MLEFYDISILYRLKLNYKISLLKTAFTAFFKSIFSKKTIQTLVLPEKASKKRLFCVLDVFRAKYSTEKIFFLQF